MALELEALHVARGSLQQRIWKQVAFLARYANQPSNVTLAMTVDNIQRMCREISIIVKAENVSATRD